jgi:hypothetical protein
MRSAFKFLVLGGLILLGLRFFFKDAFPYYSISEQSYGRFWSQWGWLLAHVVGGTLALFMGPLQFWSGFRRKYVQLHRWTGRLYLSGVLLGASAAFYLSFFITLGWAIGVALFTLGAVWLTTSAMAYLAIRNRQVDVHKEWMIRSYVLTFAFVTFRLLNEFQFIADLGIEDRFTMVAWVSWVIPLFVTEVVLQWKRIRPVNLSA